MPVNVTVRDPTLFLREIPFEGGGGGGGRCRQATEWSVQVQGLLYDMTVLTLLKRAQFCRSSVGLKKNLLPLLLVVVNGSSTRVQTAFHLHIYIGDMTHTTYRRHDSYYI